MRVDLVGSGSSAPLERWESPIWALGWGPWHCRETGFDLLLEPAI